MSDWRRRLYDNYVSSGQGGANSSTNYRPEAQYFNDVFARHVPADRRLRILDLGCGAGRALYFLQKLGYSNASGVDASPEMVAAAARAGVGNVKLGDLQIELDNTESRSIDVVIVFDVLEHFSREAVFEICDGIFRVLKPGGRIVAHVPNAGGIFGSVIRYGDLTHELAFTTDSIRQLFNTVGFSNIKCFEDRPPWLGFKSGIRALLWLLGSAPFRLLFAAETGSFNCILSQSLLATAMAPI